MRPTPTRNAREAGRFGIEKGPFPGRRVGDSAFRDRVEQVRSQIGKRTDLGAAVPPMPLIELLRFEMEALIGFHFLAAEHLLDVGEIRFHSRRPGDELRAMRVFPVNALDAFPQDSELLAKIIHFAVSSPE